MSSSCQTEGLEARIREPRLRSLYALWQERRGDRTMPAWGDFDILEMGTWIGNLTLIEVTRDPLDFVYRVFATRVSDGLRRDMTGMRVSDTSHIVPQPVQDSYRRVVEDGHPFLQRLDDVTEDGDQMPLERLVLPLSRNGNVVDMILVGYGAAR